MKRSRGSPGKHFCCEGGAKASLKASRDALRMILLDLLCFRWLLGDFLFASATCFFKVCSLVNFRVDVGRRHRKRVGPSWS